MGVIQSGLNQALVTTAALASQSPAFEKRKQEKLRQMDIKKTEEELRRAVRGSSNVVKSVAGENISPENAEILTKSTQNALSQAETLYQKDPSDVNLKRYQKLATANQIAKGVQGRAYRIKSYSAQQLLQDREQANKAAQTKMQEQANQMNDIKQHTKYSDEDDLDNPYYYMG